MLRPGDVKKIQVGTKRTFLLLQNGEVWTAGYNKDNCLGIIEGPNLIIKGYHKVKVDEPVDHVASSFNHTFYLQKNGHIRVYGRCYYGFPGINDMEFANGQVLNIDETPILDVATGTESSIVLTQKGVYTFGDNRNGALGIKQLGGIKREPAEVPLPCVVKKVIGTVTGDTNLCLDAEGMVWGWGHNSKGELYMTPEKRVAAPIRIPYPSPIENIVQHDGGFIALGRDGILYLSGKLLNDTLKAIRFAWKEPIVDVAAGHQHILMMTESGQTYGYGLNLYGCLGDGGFHPKNKFTHLFKIPPAKRIFAGGHQSWLLTDSEIFAAGDNSYGALGDEFTPRIKEEQFIVEKLNTVLYFPESDCSEHFIPFINSIS